MYVLCNYFLSSSGEQAPLQWVKKYILKYISNKVFPKNQVWHFFKRFLDQCDAHWPARDHLINLLACLILPKVNFRAMWWTNDTPNSSKNANLGNKLDVPCPNSTYVVYVCMCKIRYPNWRHPFLRFLTPPSLLLPIFGFFFGIFSENEENPIYTH